MTGLDVANTTARTRSTHQRALLVRSALIFSLTPTVLYAIYLILLAPAQFQSEASFAVRGSESASGDALSVLGFIAPTSNGADSTVVENFIRSDAMVMALKKDYGFTQAYSRFSLDPRSYLSPGSTLHKSTSFWRRNVRVVHDSATSGATVTVSAFRSEDALRLSQGVLALSEGLVNSLPRRALQDLIAAADREVEHKRIAYEAARERLTEYTARSYSGVQASTPAQQAMALVGQLDAQLAQKRADLAVRRQTYQADAPQMQGLEREIGALEAERSRAVDRALQAPGERAAGGEIEAQSLLLDYQNAQQIYQAAIQGAEGARRQQVVDRKYIVTYIPPTRPEASNWWSRLGRIPAVFIGAALIWCAAALLYSIVRDHIE